MSKNRKKVPVLLSPPVVSGIKKLLAVRSKFVTEGNVYVFGMFNSKKSYVGATALNKICKGLQLQDAQAITSTKIRKYIATASQVSEFGSIRQWSVNVSTPMLSMFITGS
jgi:hypothetical protein